MNISNIKQLLKCYFIENGKRDLIWVFGLMALITFLVQQSNPYGTMMTAEILVALFFLFTYPDRVFKSLSNTSQSIHFLMIPASTKEKVTTGIFFVNIYMVLGLIISVWLGYSLSYLVLEFREVERMLPYMERYYMESFGVDICRLYAALSVCFFGSIYFRRKGFLKTVGITMAIGLITMLLVMFVLWLNVRLSCGGTIKNMQYGFSSSANGMEFCHYLICAVVVVFFYGLSFLRMKETEA